MFVRTAPSAAAGSRFLHAIFMQAWDRASICQASCPLHIKTYGLQIHTAHVCDVAMTAGAASNSPLHGLLDRIL